MSGCRARYHDTHAAGSERLFNHEVAETLTDERVVGRERYRGQRLRHHRRGLSAN